MEQTYYMFTEQNMIRRDSFVEEFINDYTARRMTDMDVKRAYTCILLSFSFKNMEVLYGAE